MKAGLDWMEMSYEAEFSVPLFDLPGRNTELLKSLHRFIHPRFPLRATDLHAFGGNALSDVRIRVTMFGGNGTIEVTAEKLSIRFNNLRSEQDVNICNECIAMAEQALRSALPEVVFAIVTVRPTLSLRLGDGSIDTRYFLRRVVKPGIDMELTGLGNAALYPCINLEVENEDEGWRAVLHAYDNAVDKSSIIASCWMAYPDSPDEHPYGERTDRLLRLLGALLRGLDIEMIPNPTNAMTS